MHHVASPAVYMVETDTDCLVERYGLDTHTDPIQGFDWNGFGRQFLIDMWFWIQFFMYLVVFLEYGLDLDW